MMSLEKAFRPINQGREGWRVPGALVFSCWQALRRPFEKPLGKQKTEGDSLTGRTHVRLVLALIALRCWEA
jgi:hypothetical protein